MIATAIACEPGILIADEPTTALDVTIQAQVLDLLADLQREKGTAIILITHDLGVVARMADEVAVMYAGQIVEKGSVDDIFYRPAHPYTVGLQAAMPSNDPEAEHRLQPIEGSPPDLFLPPKGCAYAARCPHAMRICAERDPGPFHLGSDHFGRCWLHHEDIRGGLEIIRSGQRSRSGGGQGPDAGPTRRKAHDRQSAAGRRGPPYQTLPLAEGPKGARRGRGDADDTRARDRGPCR